MGPIGFWGACQLICLALFLGIKSWRTINLIVRHGLNPITLRVRKRGLQGLVELSLFVNVNFWAAAVVVCAIAPGLVSDSWLLGTPLLPIHVTRYAGFVLLVLALIILVQGQTALGTAWRLGIDERHPGALVTDGIYARTRNPIYLFFDLYFAGTFLMNGTLFFALSAAFTVLNLHYQILKEEEYLAQVHGPPYEVYRARAPRYWNGWRAVRSGHKVGEVDVG